MSVSLKAGTIIDDRYQIIERIGEGGMGTIFKATEIGLDRIVAVKILHQTLIGDQNSSKRFVREGKVLATLSHPHILTLYRFGVWAGSWPYIAMEYLIGRSVMQLLLSCDRLPVGQSVDIVTQVCDAMVTAHAAGVIHRDLTPSNIMMVEGPNDFAKVIDFGLSALLAAQNPGQDGRLTGTGTVLGSLHYMSPEQTMGITVDSRSDIYSLGCVLYHMVMGRTPFDADNPIALMRHHREEPVVLAIPSNELPAGLWNVILRAMAKDPELRYQTMQEFAADLTLVTEGAGDTICAPRQDSVRRKRRIDRRMVVGVVALVVLVGMPMIWSLQSMNSGITKVGDAGGHKVLRRLRRGKSLRGFADQDKVKYYTQWLSAYGNDLTVDACTARFELYRALSVTVPMERARRELLLHECGDRARKLLLREIERGNGVAANEALSLVNAVDLEVADERITRADLKTAIDASLAKGLLFPLNSGRLELARRYLMEKNAQAALPLLDAALHAGAARTIAPAERVELLYQRARCLLMTGQKAEAVKQLKESFAYAASELEFGENVKNDLVTALMEAGEFELAITACRQFRSSMFSHGEPAVIWASYCLESEAMCAQHSCAEAYALLNGQVDSVNTRGHLALWEGLFRINLKGRLNKEDELVRIFNTTIAALGAAPAPNDADEALRLLRDCGELLWLKNMRKSHAKLLLCMSQIPDSWPITPMSLQYRTHIASQMQRLPELSAEGKSGYAWLQHIARTRQLDFATYSAIFSCPVGALVNEKRFAEALKLCDEGLQHDDVHDPMARAQLLVAKAGVYQLSGDPVSALVVYKEADAVCDRAPCGNFGILALQGIAGTALHLGRTRECLDACHKALRLLNVRPDEKLQLEVFLCMGACFIKLQQYDEAAGYYKEIMQKSANRLPDYHKQALKGYKRALEAAEHDVKQEELTNIGEKGKRKW